MSTLSIGLSITRPTPTAAVEAMVRAAEGGVPAIWSTVAGTNPDAVTILAAAATHIPQATLGTSVVPVYPRHPLVLAAQALVLADFAPGRFRLGVGPSHRPTIEGMFGIPMVKPLEYTREYLTVLRQLLWEGRVDFTAEFLNVHASLPPGTIPPRTPLLMSALRAHAFRLAGQISDGAISWVCPIPYLVETALPALRAGAEDAQRPVPPLVAHVPVVLSEDLKAVHAAAQPFLARYVRLPFYARMFAASGYPVGDGKTVPSALYDALVVSGSGPQVLGRLAEIHGAGMAEVLVTLLPVTTADDAEEVFLAALRANA